MLESALAAVAALFTAAAPAAAPLDPALDADLRCFTAISFQMGQDDKSTEHYVYPFIYYAGRIDARHPDFAYHDNIVALLNRPDFTEEAIAGEVKRCESEFKARLDALDSMGKQLGESGQ